MSSRVELVLNIARRNGGLIDLAMALALFPAVRPRTVRQLVEDLEKQGALRSGWVAGEWPARKVWVDRPAQRHYFADVQLVPGKTPTLTMGDKFIHKMTAAELVVGLTARDRLGEALFDRELERIAGHSAPDGHIVLQDGSLLILELERMIGQSWEHWAKEGEIGDSIAAHMRSNARSRYIVCAPRKYLLHLRAAVIKADGHRFLGDPPPIPPGSGCWVVTTENHRADLVWCSFGAAGAEDRVMPGIASVRRNARASLVTPPVPPGAAEAAQPVPTPTPPTPAEALAALKTKKFAQALRQSS